jgi:hypothetical protein
MKFIWNLIGLFGLAVLVLVVAAVIQLGPSITNLATFDEKALATYAEIGKSLIETGSGPEATVWKHNIKNVGELPLYKEVEAMSGTPFRFITVYMFCNAMTASRMLEISDAFSAYLPCRISMVEDKNGKLWLYTLNMDLMIHGGKALPPAMKEEAIQVKETILDIMNRGASGEF